MNVPAPTDPPRVLVVEDEMFVAMLVETILTQAGYRVLKAARVDAAIAMVDGPERIDCALLDVNLAGVEVFPVAVKLREAGVPFAFASGYGREGLPADFHESPMLQKPYLPEALKAAIAGILR